MGKRGFCRGKNQAARDARFGQQVTPHSNGRAIELEADAETKQNQRPNGRPRQ
jgi:hypothetical protein